MKYILRLVIGEDIVTHSAHMTHLYYTDIAAISTNPYHFQY